MSKLHKFDYEIWLLVSVSLSFILLWTVDPFPFVIRAFASLIAITWLWMSIFVYIICRRGSDK